MTTIRVTKGDARGLDCSSCSGFSRSLMHGSIQTSLSNGEEKQPCGM